MSHWTYDQKTGALLSPAGAKIATGYSGRGDAKNDPSQEAVVGNGPIPRGRWLMGAAYDSKQVGPLAIPLTPIGHDAHGRTAFRVHGDSIKAPGTASHGCIILPRDIRKMLIASPIRELVVT